MTDITLRALLYGVDKSASSSIKGVGQEAHSTATVIGGAFSKLGSTIGGEVGEILDKVGAGLEGIGEHGMSMGQKLQAGGGALTGLGAALQLVGSKDKQAMEQLRASVNAAGGDWSSYREEVEKTIKAQENNAHGAADTQEALRVLVQATGSTEKATKSMTLVANLAAAKHISLADAAGMVAKIYGGSGSRTLREFGIALGTSKDKTKNAEDALTALAGKLKGQASASVDSFGGRVDVIKTKIGDWVAQMGNELGPALTAIGPVLMIVGTGMQIVAARNAAAAAATDAETGSTLLQTAAQKAAAIASKGFAAAQWLLNAALDANPIGLVIVAVAALVAIFVVAWKHSETFRDIIRGALHAVLAVFQMVWGWIKDNWPLLLGILTGPFGLAVVEIIKHWNGIESFFAGVPGKIRSLAAGMWDGIKDAFREAINFIINGWDSLKFSIPSIDTHIPGVGKIGGGSFGVPYIHPLAAGGIVTRPTLALIGEGGGPEAVIPLSRAGRAGLGGTVYNINVSGALDPDAVARKVDQMLRRLNSSTGGALGYA